MRVLGKATRLLDGLSQCRRIIGRRHAAEATLLRHVEARLADGAALRALASPGVRGGRNLIMGLTAGYRADVLAPFVESLRGNGYTGDVALLTFDTNAATTAYLAARQVRQVAFDSLPMLDMSMNSARMLKYLEVLRTDAFDGHSVGGYDYIMLTDVRDVVFQGDPFARTDGADLYYFLESGRTIGTCPINARWMQQALGRTALQKTAASPVSCAGTLIAKPAALTEYLLHMTRYIVEADPAVRHSGIDQAIHNYIMVNGMVGNARVMQNGGAVMTVPEDRSHGVVVSPDGLLHNADGSLSETVHQYDRDPVLLAAVMGRYRR